MIVVTMAPGITQPPNNPPTRAPASSSKNDSGNKIRQYKNNLSNQLAILGGYYSTLAIKNEHAGIFQTFVVASLIIKYIKDSKLTSPKITC